MISKKLIFLGIACVILSVIAVGGYVFSLETSSTYEYTFDPNLKIWTNAHGETLDMKKATCNYGLISETARTVKFGQYKENVFVNPNQTMLITVVGGASETLSAYLVSIDDKNAVKLKEVK